MSAEAIELMQRKGASSIAPPPKFSPSEHAERTLYLSDRTSAISGLINFSHTPYLPHLLDLFTDPAITYAYWCFGTQLGKTTGLFALLNYVIDYAPAPTMYQVPTMSDAKAISKDRVQQLFYDCESMGNHLTGVADDFQLLSYRLDRMTLRYAWGSINSISSHPEKYIFQDETKSIDPMLAREVESRTKSFSGRKIFRASSPMYPTDSIWGPLGLKRDREEEQRVKAAIPEDVALTLPVRRYVPDGRIAFARYYVKCPNCNYPQIFHPDRIRWPRDCAIRDLTFAAYYVCDNCEAHLTEADKRRMVTRGGWAYETEGGSTVGVQLSSIYSLLGEACTFGEIAASFIRAHITKRSAEMQSFVTSYLAWPHEESDDGTDVITVQTVVDTSANFRKNQLPPDVVLVVGGCDVHKSNLYYVVLGFNKNGDGYLINWGIEEVRLDANPDDGKDFLSDLRALPYANKARTLKTVAIGVDSGYMATDVYEWCRATKFLVPVKGRRGDVNVPEGNEKYLYSPTRLDKTPGGKAIVGGLKLYPINTGIIKRDLYDAIEAGRYHFPSDVDQSVIDQLSSEQLYTKRGRNGKLTQFYGKRKVSEGAATTKNHYLDAITYAVAMREILCAGQSIEATARRYYQKRKSPRVGQMKGKSNG